MAKAKHKYIMDYIPDKEVFKAVQFALKMHRDGNAMSVAIRKASYYYGVDMSEVAYYCGQRGGRRKSEQDG